MVNRHLESGIQLIRRPATGISENKDMYRCCELGTYLHESQISALYVETPPSRNMPCPSQYSSFYASSSDVEITEMVDRYYCTKSFNHAEYGTNLD